MSAKASMVAPNVRDRVSEEEWQIRVDLAAAYRLVAYYGWEDLIFTHLSARIPGPEHHFLINPYGLLFDEITASSLVKIDEDSNVIDGGSVTSRVNPAGFTIHSAVHMHREDAGSVMHLHYAPAVAVAAQKEGLLPISQTGMLVHKHIAYHDYEGVALNLDERERLVRDLGDKNLMILRNHGTLAIGRTVPEAFIMQYFLVKACEILVQAQAAGNAELNMPTEEALQTTYEQSEGLPMASRISWPALLRLLDRLDPSYKE